MNCACVISGKTAKSKNKHRPILRSLPDMPDFACSTEHLSLTLTLSLREREQQASDWCLADGRWANSGMGVIERRWTILPLPMGEGRGEGEPCVVHPTFQSVNCGVHRFDRLLIRIGCGSLANMTQPRWGWPPPVRPAQGSSFLATLGCGTESRWDSLLVRLGMRARVRQGRFKRL